MKRAIGVLVIGILSVTAGCTQQPASGSGPGDELTTTPPAGSVSTTPTVVASTNPSSAPSADDRVIARVDGDPITMRQFLKPLIESHGLQLLMGLVQLDMAKQDARKAHLVVSPEDVRREEDLTLEKMFKDADQKEQDQVDAAEQKGQTEVAQKLRDQIRSDRQQLLTEYLNNQHFSRTEFDLKVEINAYLRKVAEPLLKGKITDEMVQKEFGIEYGETAQIRYIQLGNMEEVAEARRRLQAGEDFAQVAREMSRNARDAAMGGEMIPFSRQTPGLPETFKQLAFSLQPGQVSDTLNSGGFYYILKLEHKFPPKAVKFESVRESLRKSMYDRIIQATMEQLDQALGRQVMQTLQIEDPLLSKQFEQYKSQQQAAIHDRQKMDEQWKREREAQSTTTQPATTAPASVPATQR